MILRDDFSWINSPGVWAPITETLHSDENPYDGAIRGLAEEINLNYSDLKFIGKEKFEDGSMHYYYRATIAEKKQEISINEGQDYKLVAMEELASGSVFSNKLQQSRKVAGYLMVNSNLIRFANLMEISTSEGN